MAKNEKVHVVIPHNLFRLALKKPDQDIKVTWKKRIIFIAVGLFLTIPFCIAVALGFANLKDDAVHSLSFFEWTEKNLVYILPIWIFLIGIPLVMATFKKNATMKEKSLMFIKLPIVATGLALLSANIALYAVASAGTVVAEECVREKSNGIIEDDVSQTITADGKDQVVLYVPFRYDDITKPFFADKGQTAEEIAKCLFFTLGFIVEGIVLTEEQVYNSEYSSLVAKADMKYREKNFDEISDDEKLLILEECSKIRLLADDNFLQFSSNQRIIGVYGFELHDVYIRLNYEEKAYEAIICSIKYTVTAWISAISEQEANLSASVCIRQLKDKCYPRLRDMERTTKAEKELIDLTIDALEIVLRGEDALS